MSGTFRRKYKELTPNDLALIDAIKEKAEELEALFLGVSDCREISLAKTNLEMSVMWAVKAIS